MAWLGITVPFVTVAVVVADDSSAGHRACEESNDGPNPSGPPSMAPATVAPTVLAPLKVPSPSVP